MQTQTAVRSDAIHRPAMPMRNVPPARSHALDSATEAESLDHTMNLIGAVAAYPRNTEIFGENEPADYLYKVVSGSVRTYKILNDGRRQIGGFYLPGDIFGLEFADEHTLSAEAIADTKVLMIKRRTLNALAGRDASIGRQLFALTGRELARVQDRILLLVQSAQERVAGFLLEMAERVSGGNSIELPMSRQDIADYLGLTIETVSRTLTSLECAAAIQLPTSRRIVLRDRTALNRINA
ncbi:MAG TPA: helix-turn-helix domain-containing protein [Xanthobacteraceae bacterium]|jgi:CRP-like cAMP-binding protein|nr:helix-turn-helix domain-containing protein [Xanthobacteraceae bacterium]